MGIYVTSVEKLAELLSNFITENVQWGEPKNKGLTTSANAPQITCNHWDSQQRTSSSSGHRLNDLSCSEWLKEIAVIRHSGTAGRKCQPTGKFDSRAICSHKEYQQFWRRAELGGSLISAAARPSVIENSAERGRVRVLEDACHALRNGK